MVARPEINLPCGMLCDCTWDTAAKYQCHRPNELFRRMLCIDNCPYRAFHLLNTLYHLLYLLFYTNKRGDSTMNQKFG
nr:MAG TPA: cationic trypsin [Caudoviricetes sp.]